MATRPIWEGEVSNETLKTSVFGSEVSMSDYHWLVSFSIKVSRYNIYFFLFDLFISIMGTIFNAIVIDISKHNSEQNSGNIWMKYLAVWDLAFLAQIIVSRIFGNWPALHHVANMNNVVCKLSSYIVGTIAMTASSHLVAMTVDRALNVTYPTWHFKKTWNTINRKISAAIIATCFIVCTPMLYDYVIENEKCQESSENGIWMHLYRLIVPVVFYAPVHSVIIIITGIVFIYQLKQRRKTRSTLKSKPKNESEDKLELERKGEKKRRLETATNHVPTNGKGKCVSYASTDENELQENFQETSFDLPKVEVSAKKEMKAGLELQHESSNKCRLETNRVNHVVSNEKRKGRSTVKADVEANEGISPESGVANMEKDCKPSDNVQFEFSHNVPRANSGNGSGLDLHDTVTGMQACCMKALRNIINGLDSFLHEDPENASTVSENSDHSDRDLKSCCLKTIQDIFTYSKSFDSWNVQEKLAAQSTRFSDKSANLNLPEMRPCCSKTLDSPGTAEMKQNAAFDDCEKQLKNQGCENYNLEKIVKAILC